MFTGIIEEVGLVSRIVANGGSRTFFLNSALSNRLRIDQSLSHSGVCLTIEDLSPNCHRVTAIPETLDKTNLGEWKVGDHVNLERSLPINGRLDGHIVQGHVDATGTCTSKSAVHDSWHYSFEFPESFSALVIEKGAICVNGISLTAFKVGRINFSVAIIPFTMEHTNIQYVMPGDRVNLEFDLLGKYILRSQTLSKGDTIA